MLEHLARLVERIDRLANARFQADLFHRRFELVAFFRFGDHGRIGTDHFDAVLFQHPVGGQIHGQIQRGLTAERRQQRLRAFCLDHLLDHLPGQRLDVGRIGHVRVGHNRRRIAIDQYDLIAFLTQRLARLGARVIKLAGLTDDDRTAADQQNLLDILTSGHDSFRQKVVKGSGRQIAQKDNTVELSGEGGSSPASSNAEQKPHQNSLGRQPPQPS